jgi:uncharacterized protein
MSIQEIKNKIRPILKRHDVKKAALFGSYARGDQKKKSDIDILIKYRYDNKTLLDLAGLHIELEKKLNKKVDLITYDSIHPLLKKIILSEQKLIYEKK